MKKKHFVVSLMLIGIVALLSGPFAWADGTCTTFLAAKAAEAKAKNQFWQIELTMHRENVFLVSYSFGSLAPNPDGSFTGHSNQLFSDRGVSISPQGFRTGQPFDIHAADQLNLSLSPTGLLHIHYSPWNFDTSWDMSCPGPLLTKYVRGHGVVTLTFGPLFTPIQ
jgi:hypothetical protein